MPICFYIYFCQQLDKSSVSFAANFGLREDANLTGSEYSWLSSIIYFAQLCLVSRLVKGMVPEADWISNRYQSTHLFDSPSIDGSLFVSLDGRSHV